MTGKWLSMAMFTLAIVFGCVSFEKAGSAFERVPNSVFDMALITWLETQTLKGNNTPPWMKETAQEKQRDKVGDLAKFLVSQDATKRISFDCDPTPCVTNDIQITYQQESGQDAPKLIVSIDMDKEPGNSNHKKLSYTIEYPNSKHDRMKIIDFSKQTCRDGKCENECEGPGCNVTENTGAEIEKLTQKDISKSSANKDFGSSQQSISELMTPPGKNPTEEGNKTE